MFLSALVLLFTISVYARASEEISACAAQSLSLVPSPLSLPCLTHSCFVSEELPSGQISILSVTNPVFGPETREYHVYVPPMYDNSKAVPLLLLFHGLNGRCGPFLKNTGFMPYADAEGFVVVSVCGSWGRLGVCLLSPLLFSSLLSSFLFCSLCVCLCLCVQRWGSTQGGAVGSPKTRRRMTSPLGIGSFATCRACSASTPPKCSWLASAMARS